MSTKFIIVDGPTAQDIALALLTASRGNCEIEFRGYWDDDPWSPTLKTRHSFTANVIWHGLERTESGVFMLMVIGRVNHGEELAAVCFYNANTRQGDLELMPSIAAAAR